MGPVLVSLRQFFSPFLGPALPPRTVGRVFFRLLFAVSPFALEELRVLAASPRVPLFYLLRFIPVCLSSGVGVPDVGCVSLSPLLLIEPSAA